MPMALFVIPDRTYDHTQRRVAYILVVVWVRHYRYADVRLCCQVDSEAKDRRMIVQAYTVSVLTQKEVRRVSTVWGWRCFRVCCVQTNLCGITFLNECGCARNCSFERVKRWRGLSEHFLDWYSKLTWPLSTATLGFGGRSPVWQVQTCCKRQLEEALANKEIYLYNLPFLTLR